MFSMILTRGVAERVGFEPTLPVRVNTLSKRAPSATRPSLQRLIRIASVSVARVARHRCCGWPRRAVSRTLFLIGKGGFVRRFRSVLLCWSALCLSCVALASPVHLQTEHRPGPLGVDVASPRFAWQSDAKSSNWMQQSYEINVGTDEQTVRSGKGEVWDSGRVSSQDSVDIAYRGPALHARTRYYWAVRVWDNKGRDEQSAPAWFETGFLSPTDWTAKWIRRDDPAAARELSRVRRLWLPNADAQQV